MRLLDNGRWLAQFIYDRAIGCGSLPSRSYLRWATRLVRQMRVQYYWSEDGPGRIPAVETSLFRLEITTWFGGTYVLWRTVSSVVIVADGAPTEYARHHLFSNQAAALREYGRHGKQIRDSLQGVELTPIPGHRRPAITWRPSQVD